jgi:hypothetical protein
MAPQEVGEITLELEKSLKNIKESSGTFTNYEIGKMYS